MVVPRLNVDPGALLLTLKVTTPERSVAVGSNHDTGNPEEPNSTVLSIFVGQFAMVGGVLSPVQNKEKKKKTWYT